MLQQLLKKLIRAGAGRSRFIIAITGLAAAMLLILASVQLQVNYNHLLYNRNNQDSVANFLVISKNMNISQQSTALSPEEIGDLRRQPFADAVGLLTPSRFGINARPMSGSLGFSTELFFESVPDQFIDIDPATWHWQSGDAYIPVVIPNAFLDMYNFGFAVSNGMPQLSQDIIKRIPVLLDIRTPGGGTVNFQAHIVGFSDRISSVLVPQAFLDWANPRFGTGPARTSRVVLRTRDVNGSALTDYLLKKGLSTDADKTRFSRYSRIVKIAVQISAATGVAMLAFALVIFSLFIQLTIASAKEEIVLLITLGASPRQLQAFLLRRFFPANIWVTLLALAVIGGLQFGLQQLLAQQSIYMPRLLSPYTIGAALLILLVLYVVNLRSIRKYINQS